uniref:Uncharacterized protein n=1 Tax=Thermosphaera aggregans TaxID=54254 RepID=A0A7C2BLI1_9CREN
MLFFGTQGREAEKVSAKVMNIVLLALSAILFGFTLLLVADPGFYDALITATVKQIEEIETYLETIPLI